MSYRSGAACGGSRGAVPSRRKGPRGEEGQVLGSLYALSPMSGIPEGAGPDAESQRTRRRGKGVADSCVYNCPWHIWVLCFLGEPI